MVGISCENASPEAERRRERAGRNGGPMKRGRRHGRSPHSRATAVSLGAPCMGGRGGREGERGGGGGGGQGGGAGGG